MTSLFSNIAILWVDENNNRLSEEHARAEIYEITGVSTDVAVVIMFIDELEAQAYE